MAVPMKDEFQLARERAQQQANAAKQQQGDALKRRYAALGMANSGSAIQQQRLANEAVDRQLGERNEGIDTQAQAEARRQKEIQDARDFQRAERLGGQEFQGSMFDKQTGFQRGEREASQSFADKQRLGAQAHQADLQAADTQFKQYLRGDALKQFEWNKGVAERQELRDAFTSDFNMEVAAKEAGLEGWGAYNPNDAVGATQEERLASQRANAFSRRIAAQAQRAKGQSFIPEFNIPITF